MGYSTRYELTAERLPMPDPAEALAALVKANENARYCLCEDGTSNASGRWYKHEADLMDHSKRYPGIVFTLRGDGEEQGDLWEKDFCNGRMVERKAVVAIPPPDYSAFQ